MTDSARSAWTCNDQVRLHYLDSGEKCEKSTPVVFLPGFGEEALDHVDLITHLAPRRVVIPDLRGRGPSDTPENRYDLAAHVADLAAVLAQADVGRIHLASYSRGTAYALGWAVQNLDRLASITIIEYPAVQLVPPPGAADLVASRTRFGRPITDRIRRDVISRIFEAATEERFYDALAAAPAIPLLVMRGTRASSMVPADVVASYRSARPDVVMEAYDDCGHDPWRRDPIRVAERLRQFVTAIDAY